MVRQQALDVEPDLPRINPQVVANTFKKGDFMACLLELIKNSTDANATKIHITTADRQVFHMLDDGRGMDEQGRRAYLNAGYSTGDGTTSAKFGTGARMFPFSFASQVSVSTVSATDPRTVYRCEFTPEELLEYYFHRHDIIWRPITKSRKTWAHDHPTGVEVTYTLRDPKRRGILRGTTLKQRLTDRLDIGMVESDVFLVDGKRLPKKQYASDTRPLVFEFDNEDLPGMGFVRFEFYRPTNPRYSDLLMTARTVGEVSFRSKFVRLLPENAVALVPPLFLQSGVCGLITADYLNGYVAHQRDEYQGVEDDERTYELLRLLESVQAEVAEVLGINLRQQDEDDAAGRKEVTALLDNLDKRYNQGQTPPSAQDGEVSGGSGGKKAGGSKRQAYFRLNQIEFEPGETIRATLVVPDGSTDEYLISYNEARAKFSKEEDGTIELVADSIGTGKLMARHRQTGAVVRIRYQIVPERWFRLQVNPEAAIGEQVVARAINADKTPDGVIIWQLVDGPGKLTVNPGGRSATFASDRVGIATLAAYAKADPDMIRDERDIQVTRQNPDAPRAFCIRGEFFVPRFDGVMGQVQYSKPVTIIRNMGNLPHRLTFTPDEPGYAKAYKEGTLALYLVPFIAREFADHFYEGEGDPEVGQWEIAQLAAEVAAEMYGAKVVE